MNSEQLLADRVHKLFNHAVLGLTATFINGSILALVLWGQVNVQNLMVWLAGVFLVVIIRLSITLSYFKAAPSYNDAPKWKNLFCVSLFLSGMLWGSPAIFLFPSSSVGHQVFIAFVAGGMAVGAAATFTSILSAYYLFSVPALLPLVIRFFSVGSEIHIAMGFMILIFFFLMSLVALYTHKDFSRLLVLRYENFDLVDELRQKNRQVEAIVATRTAELKKTVEQLRDEVAARKEAAQARKLVEEQLQALNDDLERRVESRTRELQETQAQYLHAEKLSAIGKLSASIAHEFNSPLQGVITILQSMKSLKMEEKDRNLLDLAISEGQRMKNLICNLQGFNRPTSGKRILMDLHASIDSLLLFCKSDFKRKGISTVLHYAERLPQILAVPDQMKQVFLNLLNNAADACPKGSGIITISTWQEENRVVIAIKDNGIGIESEKLGLIFQPFYTTKPEVKGTGLGLSVCHGIIQNHQGEILVESQPGEGSTFTVQLPVNGENEAT